jgi:hypothetical protein
MRSFDPRAVGRLECRASKTYYPAAARALLVPACASLLAAAVHR